MIFLSFPRSGYSNHAEEQKQLLWFSVYMYSHMHWMSCSINTGTIMLAQEKTLSPVWSLRTPQVAESTRLRSRNRKEMSTSAASPAGSREGFICRCFCPQPRRHKFQKKRFRTRDQSRPTLTKCDRSVLPLFVARQHCAVEAMLASTKG